MYLCVCVCVCPSVYLCSKYLNNFEPINFIFDESLLSDLVRKPFDFEKNNLPAVKAGVANPKCWPNDRRFFGVIITTKRRETGIWLLYTQVGHMVTILIRSHVWESNCTIRFDRE